MSALISQAIKVLSNNIYNINFSEDRNQNVSVIKQCIHLLIKPEIKIGKSAAVALLFQIGKCRLQSVVLNESVNKLITSFNEGEFTAKNIGNACYGLSGLSGRDPSTQVLVAALAKSCSSQLHR